MRFCCPKNSLPRVHTLQRWGLTRGGQDQGGQRVPAAGQHQSREGVARVGQLLQTHDRRVRLPQRSPVSTTHQGLRVEWRETAARSIQGLQANEAALVPGTRHGFPQERQALHPVHRRRYRRSEKKRRPGSGTHAGGRQREQEGHLVRLEDIARQREELQPVPPRDGSSIFWTRPFPCLSVRSEKLRVIHGPQALGDAVGAALEDPEQAQAANQRVQREHQISCGLRERRRRRTEPQSGRTHHGHGPQHGRPGQPAMEGHLLQGGAGLLAERPHARQSEDEEPAAAGDAEAHQGA